MKDHRVVVAAQRRARMRATLLHAGLTVMARKGIGGTSIDDVVKQADIARGSFYKYFDNTDALAEAIGTVIAQEMVLGLEPEMDGIPDPAQRLATGVMGILAMVAAQPLLGRFLVRSGWPAAGTGSLLLAKIGATVREGVDSGRFLPVPLPVSLAMVGGVVIGCSHDICEGAAMPGLGAHAATAILRGLGIAAPEADTVAARCKQALAWRKGEFMQAVLESTP